MKAEAFTKDRRQAMLSLPWYVNGTLDDKERAEVEMHLAECAECREALAREMRLASVVAELEAADTSVETGRAALERMLDRPRPADRWKAVSGFLSGALRRDLVWAPSLALAFLVAVMVVPNALQGPGISEDTAPFRTLTDTNSGQATLKVLLEPGAGEEALAALAERHSAVVVSGPSEGGVFTLAVTGEESAQDVAKALEADPIVDLVDVAQ